MLKAVDGIALVAGAEALSEWRWSRFLAGLARFGM